MHEFRFVMMLMADPFVTNIEDQPRKVRYVGRNRKTQEHTFDYLVTFRSGTKLAFAVKPSRDFVSSDIKETLKRIRAQGHLNGFADGAVLISERFATKHRGWNARHVVRACRARIEKDCEAMRDYVRALIGSVNARELIRRFPDPAAAMNAVWCLLYDGTLKHLQPDQRLIDAPQVSVVREFFEI